ncbi:hypothetical protein BX666DRAFT_1942647 [Dichotomocladium elegans]|nr:hypothetical protein BX666DRAFT_1942647 [Dichotomocladium elegans]
MQAEDWKTLTNDIHVKCVTYDYSDSGDFTLPEYIVNLLQTGNDAAVINAELQQLVGSDYDTNLTAWMFARREELEKARNPPPSCTPTATSDTIPAAPSSTSLDTPASVHKPKAQPNRIFAQAIGDVSRTSKGQPPAPSGSVTRRHTERSRSRSPELRGRQRDRSPDRSESPSNNVLSRLGNHNGRQVSIVSDGKSDGRSSVFNRLGSTKPIASPKKERCKFWPSCNKGEQCNDFHPKTICPDFPHCPKPASECLFIHPETHSSYIQQQQQAQAQAHLMAAGTMTKKPYPCKFYPNCINPACPFIHPDEMNMGFMPMGGMPFIPQQQQQPMAISRVPIPCKNGENCKRPGCHFLHPGDESTVSEVVCKYDGICTRPNCYYKHTKPHPAPHAGGNRSLVLNNKKDISERQFTVADDEVVERIIVGESADLIQSPAAKTTQQQQNGASSAETTAATNT